MNFRLPPSGLILLDKPEGVTSCNALFPIRKIFQTRRVGHAGSLDMRASGLIVAAVGRATRLLPFVEAGEKSYTFNAHFGYSTRTDEWDGELLEQDVDPSAISEAAVQDVIPGFLGKIRQVPPDFSAVKLNGKRASDLKRKGRPVELSAREIFIRDLRVEGLAELPGNATGSARASYRFTCTCSKGTYIRALVRDMAKALGTFGAVSGIRRTRIGHLDVADAVKPENLDESSLLKPQDCMGFPVVEVTDRQAEALKSGRSVTWNGELPESAASDGRGRVLLAVGKDGLAKAGCSWDGGRLVPKFYLGSDDG